MEDSPVRRFRFPAGERWKRALAALLLALLVIAAYFPALQGGYVWDDDALVTENPNLRTVAGLAATWTDPRANTDYYPLTHTSWWLEQRLFGLNPFVFHLDNVLLHLGNGLLFWLILRRLAVPGAFAAAAVFLLHPLHVESVAWVAERKNVLSGLFCLLTVWCFVRSALAADGETARRRRVFFGLSLLFFCCALLAKPMTMAVAAVLPLLAWWKRGRLTRAAALAAAPYFALALPMAALTIWVQYDHVGASGESFDLSLPQRTILAGRALWFYAGKLAWPRELTFAYPKWTLDAGLWWNYLYPLGAAAALAALGFASRRIGRGPLAGAALFAIMLSPALGFVNVYWHRYYYVADHMPYLAGLGLIAPAVATAAAGADRLVRRAGTPTGRRSVRYAAGAALAVLLLLLAALTWRRSSAFRDEETLWRDTIARNPSATLARINLGILLARRGVYGEAAELFRAVLDAEPGSADALTNLAHVHASVQRPDEAEAGYRAALRADPRSAPAHAGLGSLLQARGDHEAANRHFTEAFRISPDQAGLRTHLAEARYNLGKVLDGRGDLAGAVALYREALRIDPNLAEAHNNLGIDLALLGRRKEAAAHFRAALGIRPDYREAAANLDALGVETLPR